jgi:hypothetical protein
MKTSYLVPLAGLLLSACLQTVQLVSSPATFIPERQPDRLRVLDNHGGVFVLDRPQLVGDTIRGYDQREAQSLSVALADVRRVEARQLSRTRLALAALGLTGGGYLIYHAFANASDGPSAVCNRDKFSQIVNYCEPVSRPSVVGLRIRVP